MDEPREPGSGSERADPTLAMERASDAFARAVIAHLKDGRGVHVETALTAAAGMAGNALLRGTGLDLSALEPGSAVLGTGVDDSGPDTFEFLARRCAMLGFDPTSGWTDAPTAEHDPLVSLIDLVRDLRPAFDAIVAEHGVPAASEAQVAAAAAVELLSMARHAVDPEVGKAVISRALVAGSKTVPHR